MEMMHALSCLLLLATVADAQRPARGAHVLMGTWRLVEFADLDKNGKWQYRFGEHPRGYFVYDATGHVHIQIMKTPPLPMFLSYVAVVSLPCAAQQDSSIRVTVVDSQAATVSGAEVRLTSLPSLIGLPAPDGSVSFKNVAPGTYQISATARGFRDEIASDVVVVAGKTTELTIKLKQTLPKASDFRIHQTLEDAHLYSKTLTDIGQPLLCSQPIPTDKEWYRFMWMPTFDHPAFLRVDIDSEGSGTLLTQVWRGAGGYEWGKSAKQARKLTTDEESDLFLTLADIGFWTLPSQVEYPPNEVVLDGTDWLIEGVKDGKCHVVTRYSTPLTEFFEEQFLVRVAKLKPFYKDH